MIQAFARARPRSSYDAILMSKALALEAYSVSKRFGHRHALSAVDLVVKPGQLHGVLGPNGAGKTTLLRILLGLVRRDVGTVRLLGCDQGPTAGPLPDGVAGFVETPAFYPYLSGRGNLELLARLDGCRSSEADTRIRRALTEVQLSAEADAPVSAYSAGMRQRLGFAALLLRSPQLVLLDEPTSSLDPARARDIRALAQRLASDGAAVVLSSHDLAEVEELCGAITVIDRGQILYSGSVDDLRACVPASVCFLRTNNDEAALAEALRRPELKGALAADAGLEVWGSREALDAYVITLGCAGIAIRELAHRSRSLESLFLELTGYVGALDASPSELGDAAIERRPVPALP